jgi:phage regulator Rha-like protein
MATTYLTTEPLEELIRLIRGQRVILDVNLARIYGVEPKALNRAVKRNQMRFPTDFVFQLNQEEFKNLRCQTGTSSLHGGRRYLPFAFTEHGAIMAATVLNSPQAVQMSVFVVRAFVKMREMLTTNKALADKLVELERKLTGRMDVHERAIVHILDEIKKLMNPQPQPESPRKQIGFHAKEGRVRYRARKRVSRNGQSKV